MNGTEMNGKFYKLYHLHIHHQLLFSHFEKYNLLFCFFLTFVTEFAKSHLNSSILVEWNRKTLSRWCQKGIKFSNAPITLLRFNF